MALQTYSNFGHSSDHGKGAFNTPPLPQVKTGNQPASPVQFTGIPVRGMK